MMYDYLWNGCWIHAGIIETVIEGIFMMESWSTDDAGEY